MPKSQHRINCNASKKERKDQQLTLKPELRDHTANAGLVLKKCGWIFYFKKGINYLDNEDTCSMVLGAIY